MKKVLSFLFVTIFVTCFMALNPVSAAEPIKLKFSAPLPPAAAPAIPVKWWLDEVLKRAGGRVAIKIYWGGSLVKTKETLDAVQNGFADIGLVNAPHYPDKLPLINMQPPVFFSPGDPQVLLKLYRTMMKNPAVLNDIERYNVKPLFTASVEAKNVACTKPIRTLADLKGKKIGTVGVYYPKALKAVGAVPVTCGAVRMYQSLQTGVIDGVAIGFGSMGSFKLYEVAKQATQVELGAEIVGLPVINRDVWNKLPADIQKIFLDTAEDAMEFHATNLKKYTAKGIEKIKGVGGSISEMSWDDKVKWANSMGDYPAEWAREMDAKGMAGTEVMKLFLSTCRELGHKFPREWQVK